MIRIAKPLFAFALALLTGSCADRDDRTELVIQRFFGACQAEFGNLTDPAQANGECGIITAMINQFRSENPDIKVVENTVFWPGYDQLNAQLAANGAPDLVTMHSSVIPDYKSRDLLQPLGPMLATEGIVPADFTAAARAGVTVEGEVMGLPMDVWATLWHINQNLFDRAGLVRDGEPILPRNVDEFMAQAAQFEERTGKPYLAQITARDFSGPMRSFYIYMMQQGANVFNDERNANFDSPEGRRALQFMRDVYARGYTTPDQDYTGSLATFLQGDAGIVVVGTWMVGELDARSKEPDSPFYHGYAVRPVPQLFDGPEISFVDGHNWVMPRDDSRSEAEQEAALRFLRFFAQNDFQWSRTGHFPAFTKIIESREWQSLPHRAAISSITRIGKPLPSFVRRQAPIENVVGEEAAAAMSGAKPVGKAISDMQRRTNEILRSF
ncbi:extracellular solute-binding protein [Aurantiacibacter suaedae]|uniref:extracellular solute-binding protein n=1 Tax=Aurantiacibacter suaedae TaxID=2545755 RepID=UPI0010F850F8|nr:extracellular solute-binding protein [Aurantiacibacter suaedae]